ncbi:MAG: 50S ribosomal protein L1 [Thaumarchaeota archaeon]|nr:MAG: 50S ribosomal protein L1 [Nitrososphaerota archaeon]TLX81425.1 MAG: 50S ribosomal protein L1 [Nitrososphaerota archaeon]
MISDAHLTQMVSEAKKGQKQRKFKQTVELIMVFRDIDVKKGFAINETVQLPRKLSHPASVCVVASGDLGLKAKSANADRVVDGTEVNKVGANKRESRKLINGYDFFLSDTSLMATVGKTLGQFMGPRGKMPTPVPFNAPIDSILERFRSSIRVRLRNSLSLACKIGDETMSDEDLVANANAVIGLVEKKLPSGDKNIKKIMIKTTMGKLIKQPLIEKK